MARRYYELLGVPEDADTDTIRKAYRKLARTYHPDVNRDDPQAEERFKEIGEAYAALSDPERRRLYDTWGEAGLREGFDPDLHRRASTGNPFGGFGTGPNVRFSMGGQEIDPALFEELFGGGGNPFGGGGNPFGGGSPFGAPPSAGNDLSLRMQIPFEDAIRGFRQRFTYLRPTRCATCGGSGRSGSGPCSACGGAGLRDQQHTLTVSVPSGARDADKLRLKGKGGDARHAGARPGDLVLTLEVAPHPHLRREDLDLVATVHVSPFDVLLGATVDVQGLDRTFGVKLPAGTLSGKRLRISGHGVERKGKKGNLLAEIVVDPSLSPTDDAARTELESLRQRLQTPSPATEAEAEA